MKLITNITIALSLLLGLSSCDPFEQVGPRLCPTDDFVLSSEDLKIEIIGDNPGVLPVNGDVSLAGNGLNITAQLSEPVAWNLTIEMNDGSAEKSFAGEGDSINIFWYGNSTFFPFFKKGKASIKFSTVCRETIVRNLNITESPTFSNVSPEYGILLRDWDGNGVFPVQEPGTTNFGWGATKEGFNWAATADVTYINDDPSPMGGYYLDITDKKENPVWYYGTTGIEGNNFNKLGKLDSLPTKNAEDLWFNIYVKGDQAFANTSVELEWSTKSGRFTRSEHLNWEGWKMISIPFSEFKKGTDRMTVFDGFNSNDRSYLGFQLGSQPLQDTEAQASFDFVIITVGSPFFDE